MAVQFFFKDPEKDNMGEVLSSGYKAGLEMRAGQIKKDLDATYNQHVVTEPQYDAAGNVTARPGDLDHAGFIKSAQAAGLPMQESMQYLAHQKAQRDAMLDQAQTDSNIRDLGYDPSPSVTGRPGAPIGTPPNAEQAYLKTADKADKSSLEDWFSNLKTGTAQTQVAPTAEEIAANDKLVAGLRSPSEVAQTAQGGITNADVARTLGIGGSAQAPVVSADGTQMDLGEGVIYGTAPSKAEEAKMTEPAPWDGIYTPVPKQRIPDTRTVGQAVQDTYNPPTVAVETGIEDAELNGVFDWAPVDDGSNEFRKYKTTLDSHLKSAGMVDAEGKPDASKLLKEIYVNVYNQNLSPKPDPKLRALGAEGRKAYIVAEAEYKASQIKAAGIAGKAVLDQRQKLSEEANKYGVQTNDSTEEKRKKEKFEADLAGRRPEDYKFRYVTDAEAAKGRDITSAYFDVRDGIREGGFAGAYKAAVAKAKADGSVNRDAIIANLIAMNAAASSDAIKLNFYMNNNGNLTEAGLKWVTSKKAGKGPSGDWGKSALANLAETARLYGFDPEKKKVPPPDKKDPGSKRGPKNWTSKPDGTQQVGDTYKGHTLGTDGKWH